MSITIGSADVDQLFESIIPLDEEESDNSMSRQCCPAKRRVTPNPDSCFNSGASATSAFTEMPKMFADAELPFGDKRQTMSDELPLFAAPRSLGDLAQMGANGPAGGMNLSDQATSASMEDVVRQFGGTPQLLDGGLEFGPGTQPAFDIFSAPGGESTAQVLDIDDLLLDQMGGFGMPFEAPYFPMVPPMSDFGMPSGATLPLEQEFEMPFYDEGLMFVDPMMAGDPALGAEMFPLEEEELAQAAAPLAMMPTPVNDVDLQFSGKSHVQAKNFADNFSADHMKKSWEAAKEDLRTGNMRGPVSDLTDFASDAKERAGNMEGMSGSEKMREGAGIAKDGAIAAGRTAGKVIGGGSAGLSNLSGGAKGLSNAEGGKDFLTGDYGTKEAQALKETGFEAGNVFGNARAGAGFTTTNLSDDKGNLELAVNAGAGASSMVGFGDEHGNFGNVSADAFVSGAVGVKNYFDEETGLRTTGAGAAAGAAAGLNASFGDEETSNNFGLNAFADARSDAAVTTTEDGIPVGVAGKFGADVGVDADFRRINHTDKGRSESGFSVGAVVGAGAEGNFGMMPNGNFSIGAGAQLGPVGANMRMELDIAAYEEQADEIQEKWDNGDYLGATFETGDMLLDTYETIPVIGSPVSMGRELVGGVADGFEALAEGDVFGSVEHFGDAYLDMLEEIPITGELVSLVRDNLGEAWEFTEDVIHDIGDGISDAAHAVGDFAGDVVEGIGDGIREATDFAGDVVDGIGDGIKEAADFAGDVVDGIGDGVKEAADFAEDVVEGIGGGVKDAAEGVVDAIKDPEKAAKKVVDKAKDAIEDVGDAVEDVVDKITPW